MDVVAAYLASQPDSTVSPRLGRVRLLRPLPPSPYRFEEIQALHGVPAHDVPPPDAANRRATAGQTPPVTRH